jgi:FkbM family methyltransferase
MDSKKIELDVQDLVKTFMRFYRSHKFNPKLNNLTTQLLKEVLSARGFNNYQNHEVTGETFFIEKILAPTDPKLVIDVGAKIGSYSREILEKTNANVISFEPVPVTFEQLQESLSDFGQRVVLENKGVGATNEILTIHYSTDRLGLASFCEEIKKINYVKNNLKADVPVITLDEYILVNSIKEIDFVKIDTEGFELEVFQGAINTFSNIKPKFIQIEFNLHQMFRNTSLNYFAEQLSDYDLYQLLPNSWVKRDAKDPYSNIYQFSNFVFVRIR